MADYPTAIPWVEGSRIERQGGFAVDRAQDGTGYVRRMYSSDKRMFTVRHILTESQKSTLQTFYNDRMSDGANFNLYIPGVGSPAVVRFVSAIDGIDLQDPNLSLGYDVVVSMMEV